VFDLNRRFDDVANGSESMSNQSIGATPTIEPHSVTPIAWPRVRPLSTNQAVKSH
jgi:hypothetical protein